MSREEGAAGQFKRVENSAQSSFDHLGLRDHTNQYGPSHAAFSSWKKSGTVHISCSRCHVSTSPP